MGVQFNTSSFIDTIKDIFLYATKSDVVDMLKDNHFLSPYAIESNIKDIQPFFDLLLVTFENGYEFTFQKDGDNIKIVQIGNGQGDYVTFGSEGIDSLYDIIPAIDRAGDKETIRNINIYNDELWVELRETTYVIDTNTKKIKQFYNDSLGYVNSIALDNYIDEFARAWSKSKNSKKSSADDLKSLYNLSADNITSVLADGNYIYLKIDNRYSLRIDAKASDYHRFKFSSNGVVLFDNTVTED